MSQGSSDELTLPKLTVARAVKESCLGPFRLEFRAASAEDLAIASKKAGVTFSSYESHLRLLDKHGSLGGAGRDYHAHHPDERVRMLFLRKNGVYRHESARIFAERLALEAEAERKEGIFWNPLLDLFDSLWGRGESMGLLMSAFSVLGETKDWFGGVHDWREMKKLLRFRSERFREIFYRHAGALGDELVEMGEYRNQGHVSLARNPNLSLTQAEKLFFAWAEEGWINPGSPASRSGERVALHGYQALLQVGFSQPEELKRKHWEWLGCAEGAPAESRGRWRDGSERRRAEFATMSLVYDPTTPGEWLEALVPVATEIYRSYESVIFEHPNTPYWVRRNLARTNVAMGTIWSQKLLESAEGPRDISILEWALRPLRYDIVLRFLEKAPIEVLREAIVLLVKDGAIMRGAEKREMLVRLLRDAPSLVRGLTTEQMQQMLSSEDPEVRLATIAAMGGRLEKGERARDENDTLSESVARHA